MWGETVGRAGGEAGDEVPEEGGRGVGEEGGECPEVGGRGGGEADGEGQASSCLFLPILKITRPGVNCAGVCNLQATTV